MVNPSVRAVLAGQYLEQSVANAELVGKRRIRSLICRQMSWRVRPTVDNLLLQSAVLLIRRPPRRL